MSFRLAVKIVTNFDARGVEQMMAETVAPGVKKAAGAVRDMARDELTAAGREDTGTLKRGIASEVARMAGREVVYRVVSDQPYARYVHDGTTGPILPRRAKVLRFTPRGGPVVFAPSVKGIKATPYLTDAMKRLRVSDYT